MNTRQYYYLTTIAGFGNLSHAAQALRVSPSALSKFLSECERNFGSPLFLRYGRRLYPTAVGRDVIDAAQRILDEQSLFDFFIKVLFITLLKCYPIFSKAPVPSQFIRKGENHRAKPTFNRLSCASVRG